MLLLFIVTYKYVGLFIITFIAAFIFPLPASTVLILSSALSTKKYLNIFSIVSVAILGNIAGDFLGYYVSRRYGKEFLYKIGFKRILSSEKYMAIEKYLNNNTGKTIFITRFTTEVGPAVNLLCGLARVPFPTFALYDILGESTQVFVFAGLGYFFGNEWEKVNGIAGKITLALSALIFMYFISLFGLRNNRTKQ